MNDRVHRAFRLEDRVQRGSVANVGFVERHRLAGDRGNPPQAFLLAVAEVVDDGDVVPGLQKFNGGVAADKAGSARNQYLHDASFRKRALSLTQSMTKTTAKFTYAACLHFWLNCGTVKAP
ncbi:MAG: hypothetical protein BWX70_03234 [Verrucomicrobia bacterium ADurb.Bin070]|nr:MAG: hypothetical protein BWX70_03234 [Verrucomicrobia bacterium ADurb.Bin070]